MGRFYEKRHKKLKGATLYQHLPTVNGSFKQEEWRAYKRLILVALAVLVFAILAYFWAIPAVNFISSFWLNLSTAQPTHPTDKTIFIFPPRLDSLPTAINDLTKFRLGGWTLAGADVQIFINQNEATKVLADGSGRFEATDLNLKEGLNEIYAVAKINNQTSQPSNIITITFDNSKPELIINEPVENTKITDSELKWLIILGVSGEKTQVFINEHQAIVDQEGNFKYHYPLTAGENKLRIVARDEAGNETVVERTVNFEPPISPSPGLSPSFPS